MPDIPPDGRVFRVLVVEDQALVSRAVLRMLPPDRFEASVAETRAEARAALEVEPRPDLLLVDQGLPDGDGVEVVIEAHERFALPGIVMSGDLCPPDVDLPWLEKPFQRSDLVAALERVLGGG